MNPNGPMEASAETCGQCGAGLPGPGGMLCPACFVAAMVDAPVPAPRGGLADERIAGYQLLEEIGRGGMGVVYRARQGVPGREVALKMILHGSWASTQNLQRFRDEVETVGRLDHPNIIPIYDAGEHQGQPFFVMKLVTGGTLADRLGRGPLELRMAAEWMATLARAVHYAHQSGVIHRDLKPGNVLLDESGHLFITDFGLAKGNDSGAGVTGSLTAVGSPGYMSPEQAAGGTRRLTSATDVFSLGAILYECLTGQPPFRGATPLATLEQVLRQEPRSPRLVRREVDPDLSTLCLKCLEKEPQRRYSSAAALAEELERWLRGEPILARPAPALEIVAKWARRNPRIASLSALLALSLLAGVGGVVWQWSRAERSAREETRLREEAQREQGRAERNLYAADMLLAHDAIVDRNLGRARTLLERHLPRPGAEDLRGWEWHYLQGQCRSDELRTLGTHSNGVAVVRFSPDGRLGVSADTGGGVRLWDPAGGPPLRSLAIPGKSLHALEFSPDGARVAVAMDDRVELRDAAGWEILRVFRFDAEAVAVTFSREGTTLVMGTRGEIVHWDLGAEREVARYAAPVSGRYTPGRIALSPDGATLAFTARSRIRWRDLREGTWIRNRYAHERSVTDLAWSPDGTRLFSVGMDATLRVWDRQTGNELTNHTAHTAWPACLGFSPDGRLLATAGGDQRLILWDLATWREVANFKGSGDTLTSLAFAPDGRTLLTGGADGVVRLWPTEAPPAPSTRVRLPDGAPDPMLSPDGRAIAVRTSSRQLRLWDAPRFREREPLESPRSNIVSFAVGPGGRQVAIGTDGGWVALAEVPGEGGAATWLDLGQHGGEVTQVVFSADGRVLASVGRNDEIRIWDLAARRTTSVIPGKLLRFSRPCGLSTDGSRIAVLTSENQMEVYTTSDARRIATLPSEAAYWDDPAFTPDGRSLATMTEDGRLQLWDLATGERTASLRGQLLHVHWVGFSADGRRMVTGTGEVTVKIWDLASLQEVATLRPGGEFRPVLMVHFTPDGDSLVALKHREAYSWSVADGVGRETRAEAR